MDFKIIIGDAVKSLRDLKDGSIDCCVTSPPYWGLRDYGVAGQMGLESTPAEYVAGMVEVFREVRRVLKDDGTLWLNIGDSYAGNVSGGASPQGGTSARPKVDATEYASRSTPPGLKPKNLVGIPWRVAFALQADGWYLRSDIIWAKPNPMPESVTDRPTKAHEYLFLLSKSERYYYDAGAIAEESIIGVKDGGMNAYNLVTQSGGRESQNLGGSNGTRNKRTVWTVATEPYAGAHFAVMPTALVKPCVLAGCRPGGLVLDPFAGSGTVGVVALENGANFVGIELNPEYAKMATDRIGAIASQPTLF